MKLLRLKILSICFLFICMSSSALVRADSPPIKFPDLPLFYFDALSFTSDQSGMSRLDIYIEMSYAKLHFVKDNDLFRASYEVTIDIYDQSDKLVEEKWWSEKIETIHYQESVSPIVSKLSHKSFLLPANEYIVSVQVRDVETNKIARSKRKVEVRDYATSPFTTSDIMLVSKLDFKGEKKIIYPNISGNVGVLGNDFSLFFEIYNRLEIDSTQILVNIHNVRGDIVRSDSFVHPLLGGRTASFHKVNTSNLVAGEYLLEIYATPKLILGDDRFKDISATSFRPFIIRWRGLPRTITDLDLAIDQLQYIANRDEIDSMKGASPEKKREMFTKFWKKRDLTPNSERNELMEEYYSRVEYANKHFSHYREGWKTDMGMVYIIFGVPSNIESHPFDIDTKPYEIWTYYQQNREFIFVDATGFGDYKLQNPTWNLDRIRPR